MGGAGTTLGAIAADPVAVFRLAGLVPDDWQARLIRSAARQIVVLCSRRAGKSHAVAARVLSRCLTRDKYLALIFSPTLRQSKVFLEYVRDLDVRIGHPVPLVRESLTELAWANGSRVVSMPDSPKGSVGFTPALLVLDEGARISDELYLSVRPMLVLGRADIIALSTPFGKRGWFYGIWNDPARLRHWEPYRVTAYECPRIDRAMLEQDRFEMGDRWFSQEYELAFLDAQDAVFSHDDVQAAMSGWDGVGGGAA